MALLRTTLDRTPPPDALRQPLLGMLDDAEILPSLRRHAIDAVPLPHYASVVTLCRPDRMPARDDAALRADCSAFARHALNAPRASILSRMVASAMLRRLHKGSAIEREAFEYRRQYVWLAETVARQRVDPELLQRDLARYGEWEAWQRAADRSGVARLPDAAWVPKNPQSPTVERRTRRAAALTPAGRRCVRDEWPIVFATGRRARGGLQSRSCLLASRL